MSGPEGKSLAEMHPAVVRDAKRLGRRAPSLASGVPYAGMRVEERYIRDYFSSAPRTRVQ